MQIRLDLGSRAHAGWEKSQVGALTGKELRIEK